MKDLVEAAEVVLVVTSAPHVSLGILLPLEDLSSSAYSAFPSLTDWSSDDHVTLSKSLKCRPRTFRERSSVCSVLRTQDEML